MANKREGTLLYDIALFLKSITKTRIRSLTAVAQLLCSCTTYLSNIVHHSCSVNDGPISGAPDPQKNLPQIPMALVAP